MAFRSSMLACAFLCLMIVLPSQIHGKISQEEFEKIDNVNKRGNHYLIVVTGAAELNVILAEGYGTFMPDKDMPSLDVSSRRFHIGTMTGRRAIVVMSGDGPVDAARCTQLALNIFNVKGVVNYGRAGSADQNKLKIGDVALPAQFADCGVWNWERFNSTPSGGLARLTFSDFNSHPVKMKIPNSLQSISFQPATIYPKPDESETKFFYDVNKNLYNVADGIEGNELQRCVLVRSRVCLSNTPTVKKVDAVCSASIYVDNKAYRNFLREKFHINLVDTATGAIAAACYTENVPFIPIASITNYAGGSASSAENDVSIIRNLWPDHARQVLRWFFSALDKTESNLRSVTGYEI